MRRNFARRAVKRFMPGEELSDALQATRELAPDKIGVIITRLGESLTGESQADGVRDHYLGAYDQIARDRLNAVVSVKPTQLGLDHSYDTCLGHMMALAARAEETGSEFWIGGEIVRSMVTDERERLAKEGARLFENPQALLKELASAALQGA